MSNSRATLRDAGSFIAGILVGLAIVVLVFGMMVVDDGDWQTLWAVGALITLALGITLQVVVTAPSRGTRERLQVGA